jgi:hypothetical protein
MTAGMKPLPRRRVSSLLSEETILMMRVPSLRACALAAVLAASVPAITQAADRPSGTIRFRGGSVAFLAGVNWGGGTLYFQGKQYPIQVSGLSVGAIGAKSFDLRGSVYHLHRVQDIEGTYAAANASATVGGGAGVLSMQNGAGVLIRAQSTSLGAHASLGPSGVSIRLRR